MCQCFLLNKAIVKQRINVGPDATHLNNVQICSTVQQFCANQENLKAVPCPCLWTARQYIQYKYFFSL